MFYKKLSEKKKEDEFKKRLTVRLEPSRQERITNMLQSIASTNDEIGSKKLKFENIADGDFKQRFLKNLEGNIRSSSQLPDQVFDQMVQDLELDEKLIKEHERKKNCDFAFMKMQQERAKLPAADKCDEVVKAVKKNQVIVISGETGKQSRNWNELFPKFPDLGCGKTTQVPQFILDDAIKRGQGSLCRIICTQPRRISAITIAQRVAEERGEALGKSVGYQIRLEWYVNNLCNLKMVLTRFFKFIARFLDQRAAFCFAPLEFCCSSSSRTPVSSTRLTLSSTKSTNKTFSVISSSPLSKISCPK